MRTSKMTVVLAAACMAMAAGCSENGFGGKYTATSILRINPQEPGILGGAASRLSERDYEIYRNTQRQLLTSRFVLLAALRKPEIAKLPAVQAEQGDLVRWLEKIVKVEFPADAELMSVSVARSDPEEAAALNRAVVDAYLTEVVNAERDQKRQRLGELDRAYTEKEAEVCAKREDLKKLADQLGVSESETLTMKQKLTLDVLSTYRQDMREIRAKLRSFEVDLAAQKALLDDAKDEGRAVIGKEIKRLEASIAAMTEQASKMQADVERLRNEADRFDFSSIDIAMMRNKIKDQSAVLSQIGVEREKLKVDFRAGPRVTLLQRAEVPESKD
jgi:hypothetical protein